MFYHSVLSDWNHGNAHFLRGIATELISGGHDVRIFEPHDSWSLKNLLAEHGEKPVRKFRAIYSSLRSIRYEVNKLNLERELDSADLVLVHEWNCPELVARIGAHRKISGNYVLLFHDTHHRMVTAPEQMAVYDLSGFDGVLAYGKVLRDLYLKTGLVRWAWTWHEAADIRVFHPFERISFDGDLVWVGNWGDGERTAELEEFLIEPVRSLGVTARVYGVRYPKEARERLDSAGIEYAGWLPNFEVPKVFSRFRMTIHVPRRPYVKALPGIPTIRPFEALACGIPMICSPWEDEENLFKPGQDFLVARDGEDMKRLIKSLLDDNSLSEQLVRNGLRSIRERHTCAHRVGELLNIYHEARNA